MKKRIFAGCLTVLLCVGAVGCGKKDAEFETGMANPVKQVEPEVLNDLGVTMAAPEGAADMVYSTISGTTGQIVFKLGDKEYIYRGAKTDKDISGIYEEFQGDPISTNVASGDQNVEVTLKKTDQNGYLSSWKWDNISYTLYTREDVGEQIFTEVFTELAKSSCPE